MRAHCPACEDKQLELEYLRGELALVDDLVEANRLRKALGVGLCEARMILHLKNCRQHTATRLQLVDKLRPDTDPAAVDTHICKIRRRLGHDAFEPINGEGYRLTPAGLDRVATLMQ